MAITLNGTTGITTPDITSEASLTIEGGTANGVTYLNGSKVLTSGSALTFDSADRLIVGGSSAVVGNRVEVVGATNGGAVSVRGRASDAMGFISWHPNASSTEYARISADNTSSIYFGTGASGTERMRLTSTGLAIGATSVGAKLMVAGSFSKNTGDEATWGVRVQDETAMAAGVGGGLVFTGNYTSGGGKASFASISGTKANGTTSNGLGQLNFYTTNSSSILVQNMVLDSSGNLGLGVTPSGWQGAFDALQFGDYAGIGSNREMTLFANAYQNSAGNGIYQVSSLGASKYDQYNGVHSWYTAPSGTAGNTISFNPAMTLDASGNLLVGTTTNSDTKTAVYYTQTSPTWGCKYLANNSGSTNFVEFRLNMGTSPTTVGSITSGGSTTSYNTSSDYRLKENVVGVTGASARVQQLNPVRFNFIADPDTTVDGFLAHEVQDVVPEAITGTKDAVDAEGNPEYQGIDQSKLVPLLTAALQEALTKIETLEARVAALESA